VLDHIHPHRAAIEAALVERERSLFDLDLTVYLYDLTSTYFEGACARNPKAKRGYSRDHRPDCKQVVVALVINRDGFAITHEVFAGNTQDRATLATMLDVLTARAGLKEGATVVVDRGMAFDENIAEIKRRKLHYVVACRQPERDRWLADFDDTDGLHRGCCANPRRSIRARKRPRSRSRSAATAIRLMCCAAASNAS
jgi:Transposase DDE domain